MSEQDQFPVESFREAASHLRRPFAPGAVHFKLQKTEPQRGMVVAYVTARHVIERMNLVVPHLWADEFERMDGKWMRCHLTIDGITRSDVGTGGDLKAMFSDSLKRAAVHFGIGVSLYAMKQTWLDVGDGKKNKLAKQGTKLHLTEDNKSHLRGLYEAWLGMEDRGATFGPALDHGDDPEGSVDDLDETAPVQAEMSFFDEARGVKQQAEIFDLYEKGLEVHGGKRNGLPTKAALKAMVAGAAESNAELDKIAVDLREKAGLPA